MAVTRYSLAACACGPSTQRPFGSATACASARQRARDRLVEVGRQDAPPAAARREGAGARRPMRAAVPVPHPVLPRCAAATGAPRSPRGARSPRPRRTRSSPTCARPRPARATPRPGGGGGDFVAAGEAHERARRGRLPAGPRRGRRGRDGSARRTPPPRQARASRAASPSSGPRGPRDPPRRRGAHRPGGAAVASRAWPPRRAGGRSRGRPCACRGPGCTRGSGPCRRRSRARARAAGPIPRLRAPPAAAPSTGRASSRPAVPANPGRGR